MPQQRAELVRLGQYKCVEKKDTTSRHTNNSRKRKKN